MFLRLTKTSRQKIAAAIAVAILACSVVLLPSFLVPSLAWAADEDVADCSVITYSEVAESVLGDESQKSSSDVVQAEELGAQDESASARASATTSQTEGTEGMGSDTTSVAKATTADSKISLSADQDTENVAKVTAPDGSESYYDNLVEAVKEAADGSTVTVLRDTTCSEFIAVEKNLTIDGRNCTITSTATRILRILTSDVTVNLKNLVFASTTAERGVQVDIGVSGVELNIDNCTIPATYYAINMCNETSTQINIKNSTIQGWGALNLWGDRYDVVVEDSTLIGHNDKPYNADGWNNFGVIVLEGDTTGKTDDHVTGCSVKLINCTVKATSDTGNLQEAILFNGPSASNSVEISGDRTNFIYDPGLFCVNNGDGNSLTISGGTFSDDVSAYCIDGFECKLNDDGSFGVISTTPEVPDEPEEPVIPEDPTTPETPVGPSNPSGPSSGSEGGAGDSGAAAPSAQNPALPVSLRGVTAASVSTASATEVDAISSEGAEATQAAESDLANDPTPLASERAASFDWLPIVIGVVVAAVAIGLIAFLAHRRKQEGR